MLCSRRRPERPATTHTGPDGYLLRPRRIDYSRLGTLRGKIPDGHPSFNIRIFRNRAYDPGLRD